MEAAAARVADELAPAAKTAKAALAAAKAALKGCHLKHVRAEQAAKMAEQVSYCSGRYFSLLEDANEELKRQSASVDTYTDPLHEPPVPQRKIPVVGRGLPGALAG
eukprot:4051766-Prymnesium_polylepis.1